MFTSEFSKEGLQSAFRRVDNGHYEFARNHHHRNLYIADIANKIQTGTFDFSHIKKKTIRDFYAYRTSKLGDELVLRRLTAVISQAYRIKQADRTAIVKQIISLIEEGAPKYILRLDVASFYETIDRQRVLNKIREDRSISNHSLSLLEKFFGRLTHPITHISALPELPRIAGAFYKDGDLLETQPDGFGARFAVVSAGEEAAALGNQA